VQLVYADLYLTVLGGCEFLVCNAKGMLLRHAECSSAITDGSDDCGRARVNMVVCAGVG
jgi:hypothetical protein